MSLPPWLNSYFYYISGYLSTWVASVVEQLEEGIKREGGGL